MKPKVETCCPQSESRCVDLFCFFGSSSSLALIFSTFFLCFQLRVPGLFNVVGSLMSCCLAFWPLLPSRQPLQQLVPLENGAPSSARRAAPGRRVARLVEDHPRSATSDELLEEKELED